MHFVTLPCTRPPIRPDIVGLNRKSALESRLVLAYQAGYCGCYNYSSVQTISPFFARLS